MNTRMMVVIALWTVVLAASERSLAGGTPTGTAFTYQGVLKQGSAPANGTYHLRFQLFDALTAGAQVGADVDAPTVSIADGLFTTSLDFGSAAFDGSARWLQVQVITNGGSTVTTLAPRQAVTAAPHALYALAVDGPNLPNLNASNLASGTVASARLAGTYANALSLTNPGNVLAGTFTGSGAGLTNLNASNIASGTLTTARLPSGGAWPLSTTLDVDAGTLAVDAVNNRVGIGTSTPGAKLDIQAVNGSNVLFGRRTGGTLSHNLYIDGSGNGGMQLLDSTATPRVEFGNGLTYFNYGNVGIGTASPAAPLHLRALAPSLIVQDTASAANQAGYIGFWNNVPQETGWMGYGSPGSPHLSIVNARSLGNIRLIPPTNGTVEIYEGLDVFESFTVTDDGALALFERLGSDGPMVDFRKSGVLAGTISVTGTTVTYGAFTGCHYGWSDRSIERGTLVVMTGENRRRTDDPGGEPSYGIAPSIIPNDPRCLGAYLAVLDPAQPASLDNPHQIMAVGNGDMWVVESAGGRSIQPGDYLISSDVEGHAMLDDPQRFPIGHVIARAAEAVNWQGATESAAGRRHRRISVFFENFDRGSGADAEIAALRAENIALRDRLEQLETLMGEMAKRYGDAR